MTPFVQAINTASCLTRLYYQNYYYRSYRGVSRGPNIDTRTSVYNSQLSKDAPGHESPSGQRSGDPVRHPSSEGV